MTKKYTSIGTPEYTPAGTHFTQTKANQRAHLKVQKVLGD